MKWTLARVYNTLLDRVTGKFFCLCLTSWPLLLYIPLGYIGLRKCEEDSDEGLAAFAISGRFVLTSERPTKFSSAI